MRRPLVVFGLKGTLIDRVHTSGSSAVAAEPSCHVGNFRVWVRPGAHDVLSWTSQHADIAIWSSATKRNTTQFAEAALGEATSKFVWSREHAHADDYRRNHIVHEDDSWAVSMDLDVVVREFPEYTPADIVVVDDSCSKWRFWSHRLLIVPTFDVKSTSLDDAAPMANLQRHLEPFLLGQSAHGTPVFV